MIRDKEWMGLEGFSWFFGVVESTDDPLKIGRVKVRCLGWHTEDKTVLPSENLPWAQPIQPITSAATNELGTSPTGLIFGSWVFGFFADGIRAQFPMILGSIAGIPATTDEPDVSRLARNETDYPSNIVLQKNSNRSTNIPVARNGASWSEPESPYNAVYPKNHVRQTESGHVIELDDTPGSERIHEYHKAGTYREIDSDGNAVTKIVGSNYTIVAGSDFVKISGDCNLTVEGSLRIKSKNLDIETENYSLKVSGNATKQYDGEHSVQYNGTQRTLTGGDTYSRRKPGIDHSCPTDPPRTSRVSCEDIPGV
jgi:hypothetical protein